MEKQKKTILLNVRFTEDTIASLDRACKRELRERAEMARFLMDWALRQYERIGDLRRLLSLDASPHSVNTSTETPVPSSYRPVPGSNVIDKTRIATADELVATEEQAGEALRELEKEMGAHGKSKPAKKPRRIAS